MFLRITLLIACATTLTSCGTASHYLGQVLGTANSLTSLIRARETGDEAAWQKKHAAEATPAQNPATPHDRSHPPRQRP